MNKLSRLNEESQGWLTACLDPFHDYQYEVRGLPDERTAPSIVQIHNQTVNLTAPFQLATPTWDASVVFTGFNTLINPIAQLGMVTVHSSLQNMYDGSTGLPFGALNYWTGDSGLTMATGAPSTGHCLYGALGSVQRTDRCRLIGAAFEIHNTTADVYKQGSLTVAMLPDSALDAGNVHYISDTHGTAVFQADRALMQASLVAPLRGVPGSSTWPASEGVYAVPRMTMVPRDIALFNEGTGTRDETTWGVIGYGGNTRVPILYGTDGKVATPAATGWVFDTDDAQTLKDTLMVPPSAPNGFSPMQVFLTGLSTQTTLTVSFRTIVEYFPVLTSPMLPLATPSPIFDPKVLALYSAVAAKAPYAVPVGQNGSGDYFRKVLKVVAQSLGLMAPIFGTYAPIASAASEAGLYLSKKLDKESAGAGAIQGRITKREPDKPQRKLPPKGQRR